MLGRMDVIDRDRRSRRPGHPRRPGPGDLARRRRSGAGTTGALRRVGHGRYALPGVEQAAATAHAAQRAPEPDQRRRPPRLGGQDRPAAPPRRLPAQAQRAPSRPARGGGAPWPTSDPTTSQGIATSRELTLLQCLRSLPDDEALAIADSALRARGDLDAPAGSMASVRGARERQGTAHRAYRRDARAAQSLRVRHARHLPSSVPGLVRRPPGASCPATHFWARPDLVDRSLRIVIEATPSSGTATARASARRRRYTCSSANGWTVLRFTWEDVMHDPAGCARCCASSRRRRADGSRSPCGLWPREPPGERERSVRAPTADRDAGRARAGLPWIDQEAP